MKNKEFQSTATPNSVPTTEDAWKELIIQLSNIPNKELDSRFTPKSGPITETLEFLREKRDKGEISYEEALIISEKVIRYTMLQQLHGFPVDDTIERTEDSEKFSGENK